MPSVPFIVLSLAAATSALAGQQSGCAQAADTYRQKQYSQALTLAGKSLQSDGDNASCLHLYGVILDSLGRLPEAEGYLGKAVAKEPDQPAYVVDLGKVLHDQKKYADAVPVLRHAVELAPDNLTARMMLARSYVFSFNELKIPNFVELTLEQLNYIVAKDPRFPAVHHHLALVYINTNDLEKAEQELRAEARLSPRNPQVRLELGETLLKRNETKSAIQELEIASKEAPGMAPVYFSLGKAYRADGQADHALAAVRRCVELDPGFPTCHYLLGQIYRDLNQPEQAREQFDIFQQLKPPSGPAN
jgi:predicted Zn-dependent protease